MKTLLSARIRMDMTYKRDTSSPFAVSLSGSLHLRSSGLFSKQIVNKVRHPEGAVRTARALLLTYLDRGIVSLESRASLGAQSGLSRLLR
jgi:hypothetical protein